MPPIMVDRLTNITNNIGKAYLATIMGLFMVLVEVILHDYQYNVLSLNWYVILLFLLGGFIYLYRKQIAINDKQYIESMIEHHSMALFQSDEILKKTNNYDVAKLAKNAIQTQKDELRAMSDLLKK
jgi:hypothetical protein